MLMAGVIILAVVALGFIFFADAKQELHSSCVMKLHRAIVRSEFWIILTCYLVYLGLRKNLEIESKSYPQAVCSRLDGFS